jgi:chemotaxis protein CheD
MMKREVNIKIGELYASREPVVINTLLGSCVAVCLFDPVKRIGGMNHIFLPKKPDTMRVKNKTDSHYAIDAIKLLINRIVDLGGVPNRLVAKVFGGASVISGISNRYWVGEKIAKMALDFLTDQGIRVLSQDLGGKESLRIHFHTDTGHAFLKRLPGIHSNDFLMKEREQLRRIIEN